MPTFKAVAFDYGKVLSLPPTQEQWQTLCTRFSQPLQEFQQIYWAHREELDRGTLDNVHYWQAVGRDCGFDISVAEAQELIEHDNTQWTNVSPEMLDLTRDLRRAGYRTAILSNMQFTMLAAMRQQAALARRVRGADVLLRGGNGEAGAGDLPGVLPPAGLRAA